MNGRARALSRALTVGALLLTAPSVSAAQLDLLRQRDTTRADSESPPPTAMEISPASPRASLGDFLSLTRAGRFTEAAAYLEVPPTMSGRGPALARELKAVLDRHVWIDLDEVSGSAAGRQGDGLPGGVEEIALIPGPQGARYPVRMSRFTLDGAARWRFNRATVEQVPTWYAALGDRWIREHLPPVLLRTGPLEILYWQWIALPVLLVLAYALGGLVSFLIRGAFGRVARRTTTEWDDAVLARLASPLAAACTLVAISAFLPFLALHQPAAEMSYRIVRALFLFVFFWSLWRMVDVVRDLLSQSRWAKTSASSRSLLPLVGRVAKVGVAAIAAVAILSLLGYPVASLVAGLGLGGLALALAAQKTVENLFGAFSIGADQSFREGDFVRIEDFVGTVERIGLRSTRFRTLERTLITIPNGRLAEMRLESMTARDRLRFHTIVGVVYETTGAQMREILVGFERVLREQPELYPEGLMVRFRAFGASSLDIEVACWFDTADWQQFLRIRQDVLLGFMEVVEATGSGFAFPTQTVHVASVPAELRARESQKGRDRSVPESGDGSGRGEGADATTGSPSSST